MSIVIDRNDAVTALDKAVALKGENHVQNVCVYLEGLVDGRLIEDNVPPSIGCIVGAAVASVVGETETIRIFSGTFEQPSLFDADETDTAEANECGLRTVRQHLADNGIVLTEAAFQVWLRAQQKQDGGASWGNTVQFVKAHYLPQ